MRVLVVVGVGLAMLGGAPGRSSVAGEGAEAEEEAPAAPPATGDGARQLMPRAPGRARVLSTSGAVLVGPRLARAGASGERLVAMWIEDPKLLIVAELHGDGRVLRRAAVGLPGPEARVEQLAPLLTAGGGLAAVWLEVGRRPGATEDGRRRRILVRFLDDARAPIQVVVDAPDEPDGGAPAAIVGTGLAEVGRLPSILWRRQPRAAPAGEPEQTISLVSYLLPRGGTRQLELLGARHATAATWQADGTPLIGGYDAGRPFVVGWTGEHGLPVPTPAVLTSVLAPAPGRPGWMAAGLDGAGHLFVTTGADGGSAPRLPFSRPPLVDAPDDAADAEAGRPLAGPLLVSSGPQAWLVWPSRTPGGDEVRARPLGVDGRARGRSVRALACPAGARTTGLDTVETAGGGAIVALGCLARGRADVRAVALPPVP